MALIIGHTYYLQRVFGSIALPYPPTGGVGQNEIQLKRSHIWPASACSRGLTPLLTVLSFFAEFQAKSVARAVLNLTLTMSHTDIPTTTTQSSARKTPTSPKTKSTILRKTPPKTCHPNPWGNTRSPKLLSSGMAFKSLVVHDSPPHYFFVHHWMKVKDEGSMKLSQVTRYLCTSLGYLLKYCLFTSIFSFQRSTTKKESKQWWWMRWMNDDNSTISLRWTLINHHLT